MLLTAASPTAAWASASVGYSPTYDRVALRAKNRLEPIRSIVPRNAPPVFATQKPSSTSCQDARVPPTSRSTCGVPSSIDVMM